MCLFSNQERVLSAGKPGEQLVGCAVRGSPGSLNGVQAGGDSWAVPWIQAGGRAWGGEKAKGWTKEDLGPRSSCTMVPISLLCSHTYRTLAYLSMHSSVGDRVVSMGKDVFVGSLTSRAPALPLGCAGPQPSLATEAPGLLS